MRVTGEIRDAKQVYLPMRQSPTAGMTVVARTERDPAFAAAIRGAVWSVDAEQPIYELSTMDQILARAVFLPRMTQSASERGRSGCGWARRQRWPHDRPPRAQQHGDAGCRYRCRARRGDLLARSMGGELYGISPFDLPAFVIAALALAAAGLLPTLLPAVRATRIDPIVALREP